MAVTASFIPGARLLSVFGDALGNTVTFSRDAAGSIMVNGGSDDALTGGSMKISLPRSQ